MGEALPRHTYSVRVLHSRNATESMHGFRYSCDATVDAATFASPGSSFIRATNKPDYSLRHNSAPIVVLCRHSYKNAFRSIFFFRKTKTSHYNVLGFGFLSSSVITFQAIFAWQPVVHLQSIVSHHLSTLFPVYGLYTCSICITMSHP